MIKFLIFLGIFFGAIYFFYYKIKTFIEKALFPHEEKKADIPPKVNKGEMVKCPVCGTYFPVETGVKAKGKLYCSKECMEKDGQ